MKPNSAIQKGKELEDHVAGQIRAKGIDLKALRSHGSGNGNTEKGDIWTSMMILGQNAGIECKNQRTIKLREWWDQTKLLERLGREPVLALKLPQDGLDATLAVIYLDTLLELIKAANLGGKVIVQEAPGDSREKKYALQNLKSAVSRALKYID